MKSKEDGSDLVSFVTTDEETTPEEDDAETVRFERRKMGLLRVIRDEEEEDLDLVGVLDWVKIEDG